MAQTRTSAIQRLLSKIKVDENGCHLFTGYVMPSGYAHIREWKDGAWGREYIHRVSYQHHVGEIPPGLEIDHLCRVKHCCNPEHLEAVTHRENVLRARSEKQGANMRVKTHCPEGHPYDDDNTYRYNGRRYCRECGRIKNRAWYKTEAGRQYTRKKNRGGN